MKTRIISGVAGVGLLILALLLRNYVVFNILIAIITAITSLEVALALKTAGNKPLLVLSMLFSFAFPFASLGNAQKLIPTFLLTYIIFAMFLIVIQKNLQGLTRSVSTVALTIFYSFCAYTLILLRDIYMVAEETQNIQKGDAVFILLLALIGAWGSDTGAYFVGSYLGKHKLSPIISPKKTIEGLLGGILSAVLLGAVVAAIYRSVASVEIVEIKFVSVAIIMILASLISVLGDLFSSMIKRANGIKDFGGIMPGHGGILDRFDSLYLVAPFIYVILQYVNIILRR